MNLKTEEKPTSDGRWHLTTTDLDAPERFVSSVKLPSELDGWGLFETARRLTDATPCEGSYETIMHDENGWKRTPEGNNAVMCNSEAECRENHKRIVQEFFYQS